ncbi:MAG: hypothetical protein LW832_08655 [Parachlamydia sp.]|jgi:cation transport ATPase|nr:hypothetical protein [Parachlamydia sp.]
MRLKNLQQLFKYFLTSLAFSLPFFAEAVSQLLGFTFNIPPLWQLILGTWIQLGCGWPLYLSSFQTIRKRQWSLDPLLAAGTAAAFLYSLAHFPSPLYFHISAFVITFAWLGKWLEELARGSAVINAQDLADKAASCWLFAVLAISAVTMLAWKWVVGEGMWNGLLVIGAACPCALALASPTALLVAKEAGIRNGMGIQAAEEILESETGLKTAALRKIRQNIFLAIFFNALTLPFAAGGLLTPSIATGTMAAGLISVIANSLLLRYWRKGG